MMDDLICSLISKGIDESIRNRQNWEQLPYEQQKALNEILEEIHDIATSVKKITASERKVLPQYQEQVRAAMVIKLATELGMLNGGNQL